MKSKDGGDYDEAETNSEFFEDAYDPWEQRTSMSFSTHHANLEAVKDRTRREKLFKKKF